MNGFGKSSAAAALVNGKEYAVQFSSDGVAAFRSAKIIAI